MSVRFDPNTADKLRAQWLGGLKVGDKVAWLQFSGQVRRIETIARETPKCWVLSDGWLLCKARGVTRNHLAGVRFCAYEPNMERRQATQKRQAEREDEKRALLARIQSWPLSRIRSIVKAHT